jgi:4'-phosphopantetheinyl transferase
LDDGTSQIAGPVLKSFLEPDVPPLSGSELHVWTIALHIPDAVFSALRTFLSLDEAERASRFHFEADARGFVVARGSVRSILARYTQSSAADLFFSYSAHGKPTLQKPASELRFSVSHSHDLALLAVVSGREVGVDIEWKKEGVEVDKLAERFFSPQERIGLRSQSPEARIDSFFRGWTCKEAFLKAQGFGLSRNLSSFDVDMSVGTPARLLGCRPDASEASHWSLRELNVPEGYAGAVALEGRIGELKMIQFGGI